MVILGIDPGTTRIGFGVIENNNRKLFCLGYGLVGGSTPAEVIQNLNKIIEKFKPEQAAVEKLFFFKNQKTIISVSEMRGVIMTALAINNIPIKEYTPLQVKQAVSSYGRADKVQVQKMVRLILALKENVEPDDAADGLAIAICCANNNIG